MDITWETTNHTFNCRVASLIIKDDTILLEQRPNLSYLSLPGGRLKINESTEEALIREIKEETGYDIKVLKLVSVIENFYLNRHTNKPCHELLFIYTAEFLNLKAYESYLPNHEESEATFIWYPISKLNEANFQPAIYLKYLTNFEFHHLVSHSKK